jgi:hypothetical protein
VLGLSGVSPPQQRSQQPSIVSSINDLFGGASNPGPASQMSSPPPAPYSQPAPRPSARSTPDPFAALASSTPRQASPFQFQQSIKPPQQSSGAVDLLGVGAPTQSSNLAQISTSAANDDDEWNFTSAVPDSSKELIVTNSSINVVFNVSRESDTTLLIKSRVSNNTPLPISDLTIQLAVSKASDLIVSLLAPY